MALVLTPSPPPPALQVSAAISGGHRPLFDPALFDTALFGGSFGVIVSDTLLGLDAYPPPGAASVSAAAPPGAGVLANAPAPAALVIG